MYIKFGFESNSRISLLSTSSVEADHQQHKDSNYDSESDPFKARGISEVGSEYIKWMKQQQMKRDTNIFKY